MVTRVGSFCYSLLARLPFVSVHYALENAIKPVSEMSKVAKLLKAWMEETRKQELRHEKEQCCYEQGRAEDKRCYNKTRPKKNYHMRNL